MAIYVDNRRTIRDKIRDIKDLFELFIKPIRLVGAILFFSLSIYLSWWSDYSDRKLTRVPHIITVVDKTRKDNDYIVMYKLPGKDEKVREIDVSASDYLNAKENQTLGEVMIAPQEYEGRGWRILFLSIFWVSVVVFVISIVTIE